MAAPAFVRAAPSNTMKRQGVSLPWSGTRDATVSRVSISARLGGGPTRSTGFSDRRVLSNSRASGMVRSQHPSLRLAYGPHRDKPAPIGLFLPRFRPTTPDDEDRSNQRGRWGPLYSGPGVLAFCILRAGPGPAVRQPAIAASPCGHP